MGRLTTHILDTALGAPACGVSVHLYAREGDMRRLITQAVTNDDGRCPAPLLSDAAMIPGTYELEFGAGAYFKTQGVAQQAGPFLDDVIVRFIIADAQGHYHVPLLLSPYGYSTYRGS